MKKNVKTETQAKKNKATADKLPTTEQLKKELDRVQYGKRYRKVLMSTIYALLIVAAVAILVVTLWFPVLQIYGSSMTPTVQEKEVLFAMKGTDFKAGDIIAFYYNNKILVKRVIAVAGETVDIDEDGTVYVDDRELEEPYLTEKAFGECDIDLPYQVPDGKIFVMGDHRLVSIDSRNQAVGCISSEHIVGKIVFRVWPLNRLGRIE